MIPGRKTLIFAQFILLALFSALSVCAAGDVDAAFNAYLGDVPSGRVLRTIIQPDGKIIATGEFSLVNGFPKTNIVRLNPDGTIDPIFNAPPIPTAGAGLAIQDIDLQSDGKIVIVGQFASPRSGIARLNADGTPDTAFNNSPAISNVWLGYDVKITADDKIVFSSTRVFTAGAREYLTRLNTDGTMDAEIQLGVSRLTVQPDGKVLICAINGGGLQRLNQNLTADNTFTRVDASGIADIVVQPDGKILIGGDFTLVNGSPLSHIARINSDGSVDTTFNINTAGPNAIVNSITLYPGGKILISGVFSLFNGTPRNHVALINSADGSLDKSFNPAATLAVIYETDVQPDGKILISGIGTGSGVSEFGHLVRLNTNGSVDTSFQPAIGAFGKGYRVIVQPDDKILVGGSFNYTNGAVRDDFVRFNADGTLDTGFNPAILYSGLDFDIFSDGKIIVCADTGTVRLNADGSPDIAYSGSNGATEIKALPDGRALIARGGKLQRHNTDGSLDSSFNVTLDGTNVYKTVLQPDGKILISGIFAQVNGTTRGKIARLNADGTVDTSFNPPGGANASINDIDLRPDGKIYIAGAFTSINFNTSRKYVARLNSDGSLDTSFGSTIDTAVYTVKSQPDGKILIGGPFSTVNGIPRQRYARLNADGTLDTTFYVGSGANGYVYGFDLQSSGKIVMVGEFSTINGFIHPGIVRLLNPPSVPRVLFDYDGDGKADISVFRPSENKWYVLRSSDSGVTQQVFAIAGDAPVPADYDGDGKTDFAIFRPSSSDWWSLMSSNGAQAYANWGQSGVVSLPSDFDGDGRADYIYFLPANSTWYRYGTSVGASYVTFGLTGDKPVSGDFDGDGKTDVAIFRPSTGDWWWQSSIDNVQRATHWGISTDLPAPADYDGDGKTDFAVFRPSEGNWYVFNSSDFSFTILHWGIAEDKPVAADYDGDGKADIAVFRPSTGVWYLLRSSAGFMELPFGIAGDVPTPNSFVH